MTELAAQRLRLEVVYDPTSDSSPDQWDWSELADARVRVLESDEPEAVEVFR